MRQNNERVTEGVVGDDSEESTDEDDVTGVGRESELDRPG